MAEKLTVFTYLNPFRSLTGDRSEFEVMSYFYHKYEPVIFIACIETKTVLKSPDILRSLVLTVVIRYCFN